MAKNYIPYNDGEFNTWFNNLVNYVVNKTTGTPPAWNHIPKQDVDELDAAYSDWNAFYKPTLQPHTPAQTTAKHDARRRAEHVIRPFVQRYLHWPPVTDADRVNMAIPNHDGTPTKWGKPATVPEVKADTSMLRRLRFRLRDRGASHWGKPEHVKGMELVWAVLSERPNHVSELIHNEDATANPIELFFEEEDRGKRVYFAVRWTNGSEKGPWSDIESAIIP